jgi:hypothetical protein
LDKAKNRITPAIWGSQKKLIGTTTTGLGSLPIHAITWVGMTLLPVQQGSTPLGSDREMTCSDAFLSFIQIAVPVCVLHRRDGGEAHAA